MPPWSIFFRFLKCIYKRNLKRQKIRINFWGVQLDVLYAYDVVSQETNIFVCHVWKGQKIVMKRFFHEIIYFIFIQATKMSIFYETSRTYIEYRVVHTIIYFEFFLTCLNIFFWWQEHMLQCDKINFPYLTLYYSCHSNHTKDHS